MRSIVKTIEHDSRSDLFRIVPLGDVHLGNSACDEAAFERMVRYIKDTPNTLWLGMGDMLDSIGRRDKRHREASVASWLWGKPRIYKAQKDRLIETLKPIGDKCLCYLIGNHEEAAEMHHETDLYYDIIEAIRPSDKVELAMGISGFLVLRFRRSNASRKGGTQTFTFYLHHGYGGGRKMGGKVMKLEEMQESYDADIYLMGHVHQKEANKGARIGVDRSGNIVERETHRALTGSFLRNTNGLDVTYSERDGYKPLALGVVEIEMRPGAESEKVRIRV